MEQKKRGRKKAEPKHDVMVRPPSEPVNIELMSDVILKGDLKDFSPEQKVKYYMATCRSIGLDPLTKPFDIINLNGKDVMYPNKGAAEQLRRIYGISIVDMQKSTNGGVYEVQVKAQDRTGRYEIATGSVSIIYPERIRTKDGWQDHPLKGQTLRPDELSNAKMKAETKAKRRVTFALCGLGMLDQTEIEDATYPEPTVEDEDVKKREGMLGKVQGLPDNIKEGMRLLGYKTEAAFMFCEKHKWDNDAILKEVNAIIDAKNGGK